MMYKDKICSDLNFSLTHKLVLMWCLIIAEIVLLFAFIFPLTTPVLAVVGQDNVTVTTTADIGNAFPEFVNITIVGASSIDLTPNSTTTVVFEAIVQDYNGEADLDSVNLTFFDNVGSTYGAANDNNDHYSNSTCTLDTGYGDAFQANVTCTLEIEYYANNQTWNATMVVNDSLNSITFDSQTFTVNTLLALALPDNIDYGLVNTTAVSSEVLANVSNVGNTMFNLSLSGYAFTEGDGNALNCTLGSTRNISIEHEKYNLTASNVSDLELGQADTIYTNLSSSPAVRQFNLPQRVNDAQNDAQNTTYWRLYVPTGVAGNCTGNIIFGAVQAAGV